MNTPLLKYRDGDRIAAIVRSLSNRINEEVIEHEQMIQLIHAGAWKGDDATERARHIIARGAVIRSRRQKLRQILLRYITPGVDFPLTVTTK